MPDAPTHEGGTQPDQQQTVAGEIGSKATKNVQAQPNIHIWVDTINKLFQIGALLIAGVWAWNLFARTSAPALESKLNVHSELRWEDTEAKDVCTAVFTIWAKNEGQRALDTDRVRLSVQSVDLHALTKPSEDGVPVLLDRKFIQANAKDLINFEFPRGQGKEPDVSDRDHVPMDLIGHYAPGIEHVSTATFLFKRLQNRLIIFRVDLSGWESRVLVPFASLQKVSDYTSTSDSLCGQ
jgi:hypothetical protein